MVKGKENFQVFLKPNPIKNDNPNTARKTKPTSPKMTQKNLNVKFLKLHVCYFHGRYIMTTINAGSSLIIA